MVGDVVDELGKVVPDLDDVQCLLSLLQLLAQNCQGGILPCLHSQAAIAEGLQFQCSRGRHCLANGQDVALACSLVSKPLK